MTTSDRDTTMTPEQILTAETIAPGGTLLASEWEGFALVADSHGTRYAIARDGAFMQVEAAYLTRAAGEVTPDA